MQELGKTKETLLQQVKLLDYPMGTTAKPRHRQAVAAKNVFLDPHWKGQALLAGMWGMLGIVQCLES